MVATSNTITNLVTTNTSLGTSNLSTGITSTSAQITNTLLALENSNTIGNIFYRMTSQRSNLELTGTSINYSGVDDSGINSIFFNHSNTPVDYQIKVRGSYAPNSNSSIQFSIAGTTPSGYWVVKAYRIIEFTIYFHNLHNKYNKL